MPLAYANVPWPPAAEEQVARYYREWQAWYAGDPQQLRAVYGGGIDPTAQRFFGTEVGNVNRPAQYRGGVVGTLARVWWGAPLSGGQNTTKLHIAAASDISTLSADLLFSEMPNCDAGDDSLNERLEEIWEQGQAHSRLLEAAETCSGFGGVYVRACVDKSISDVPLFDVVPPDCAVPFWRYGLLAAVVFWRVLDTGQSGPVLRHLELHEVIDGVGYVCHGLYRGDAQKLGMPVPLLDGDEECQRLAMLVDEYGRIVTGASQLDVEYVPNVRPFRLIRGSDLGRSDYAGSEGAMDALDETWSSWMRDIRLAKARLLVPQAYLDGNARGKGASFDPEQEIFQTVDALVDPTQGLSITQTQFAIRTAEHHDTAAGLWRVIVRGAGLSAEAFGEETSGTAMTATESNQRGERTDATRLRKIGYWRRPVGRLAAVMLQLDAAHYDGKASAGPVTVTWPDAAAPAPGELAKTLQLLDAAKAVSTKTKVIMLHPDWEKEAVGAEVELIDGPALPNPDTFTGVPPAPLGAPGQPMPPAPVPPTPYSG
jgi:A118 family predicted phage portal protein